MSEFRKSLKYSILMHASLFALLLHPGCGGGKGSGQKDQGSPNPSPSPTQKIAEKPEKAEKVTLQVEIVDSIPQKPKPKAKHANSECPSGEFYGGIGIYETTVGDQNYVTDAVRGYPGADIGLQFGDMIVSPSAEAIKGEVGTEVNLIVRKADGTTKTYTVIRDKICLEKKP